MPTVYRQRATRLAHEYNDGRRSRSSTGRVDAYAVFLHVARHESEWIVGAHVCLCGERNFPYVIY